MRSLLQTAVRLVYPPRCLDCGDLVESDFGLCGACWRDTPFIGGNVCAGCGVPLPGVADRFRQECDDCMKHPRPWSEGRSALLYQDRARKLVLALKHGDRLDIALPAARWMVNAGRDIIQPDVLVAPVPLHRTRLFRRRYNQAALLSLAVARIAGLEHCPDLLRRTRQTDAQEEMSVVQRFANMADALAVHPGRSARLQGCNILLVDDVMTSGATLGAAAQACLDGGANRVDVLILARAVKAH